MTKQIRKLEPFEAALPSRNIERLILLIRERKVMLDADLAELYGVQTKVLNQAVKRNKERFPEDFMFRLTAREKKEVVTICDHLEKLKFSPSLPFAFTEHGAIMLANVLNSSRAIRVAVCVVRAFNKLTEIVSLHTDLAQKMAVFELKLSGHEKDIQSLFSIVRELMAPPPAPPKRPIGFHP